MLFVLVPLIFAAYFGILAVAIWLYPKTYDWRYQSISGLLYPRNNPEFHHIASTSIVISGGLVIPFVGYIRRRLRDTAPTTATVGASLFFAGCLCLAFAGLITSHPAQGKAHLPKLHEILARLSVIHIGVGMVLFNFCGTKGYFRPQTGKTRQRRSLLISWNLLTLPVVIGAITWLVIRVYLQQSGPTHPVLGTSAAWQVGFWEWIGSIIVFLFLLSGVLFLPKTNSE